MTTAHWQAPVLSRSSSYVYEPTSLSRLQVPFCAQVHDVHAVPWDYFWSFVKRLFYAQLGCAIGWPCVWLITQEKVLVANPHVVPRRHARHEHIPAPHSRSSTRVCCVLIATARSLRLRSDRSKCNLVVFLTLRYSSACLMSAFFSSIIGLISALKSCSLCTAISNVSSAKLVISQEQESYFSVTHELHKNLRLVVWQYSHSINGGPVNI